MKYRIRIVRDPEPEAPENDLVKITYMRRSRYVLGTQAVDADEAAQLQRSLEAGYIIGVPVYAYVHSGSTIACSELGNPFSCPWDSARSGLAWMDAGAAARECPHQHAKTGADVQAWAKDYIKSAVEEFDQYLRGDVYGVVEERAVELVPCDPSDAADVGDSVTDWREESSCYGIFGLDNARKEAESMASGLRAHGHDCEIVQGD